MAKWALAYHLLRADFTAGEGDEPARDAAWDAETEWQQSYLDEMFRKIFEEETDG